MKDSANCEEHQNVYEYTYFQQFIDNLPYIVMTFLGAAILFVGIETPFWQYLASCLYILYGAVGALWIILFVCPYCHFFGTMECPCGYGRIAAKICKKQDGNLFMKKFKRHIPVIVPLWIIPTVAGIVFLISDFSLWMAALLALFAIDSFIILPLLSRKYGCAHCSQRDSCPWMKQKGSQI